MHERLNYKNNFKIIAQKSIKNLFKKRNFKKYY